MPNNNIFREAKQLLDTKPGSEMTDEERQLINAAIIPLMQLRQYSDIPIGQGLEELADIIDGKKTFRTITRRKGDIMVIAEAIENLTGILIAPSIARQSHSKEALKLGIEALKEIDYLRRNHLINTDEPLPGETLTEYKEG